MEQNLLKSEEGHINSMWGWEWGFGVKKHKIHIRCNNLFGENLHVCFFIPVISANSEFTVIKKCCHSNSWHSVVTELLFAHLIEGEVWAAYDLLPQINFHIISYFLPLQEIKSSHNYSYFWVSVIGICGYLQADMHFEKVSAWYPLHW